VATASRCCCFFFFFFGTRSSKRKFIRREHHHNSSSSSNTKAAPPRAQHLRVSTGRVTRLPTFAHSTAITSGNSFLVCGHVQEIVVEEAPSQLSCFFCECLEFQCNIIQTPLESRLGSVGENGAALRVEHGSAAGAAARATSQSDCDAPARALAVAPVSVRNCSCGS